MSLFSRRPSGTWLVAFLLVGCAPSKEEVALAHARSVKRPGAIRLVNLTDAPARLEIAGARASGDIGPGDKTIYVVAKAGKRDITIKGAGDSPLAKAEVDFKPLEGVSLFITGKDESFVVEGEPRERTASDLKLAIVNLTKSPLDASASGTSLAKAVPSGKLAPAPDAKVGNAHFEVSSDGKKSSLDGNLEAGRSYSLAVYETSGKMMVKLIENSPADPHAAGMAGGG